MMILDHPGGPKGITQVITLQEGGRRETREGNGMMKAEVREGLKDATWLGWKTWGSGSEPRQAGGF